ncbi:MAG: MFS transporter [Candidatus Taylorbacteria bacterium]|nr:MFS transporter [Candidatus Taylorbacteria bacterium]
MHNGLNLFQVNLVNAIYFLTLFLCEIPTGAFADIFGRKKSFVTACALMSISMFVYGSSHTFAGFVLAEIIAAVGSTFRSGAFQAWLVDSLKHFGHDGEDLNHIFGRENLIRQIGGAVGAVAGSYLAARNPALPWFAGGTVMALTTVFAFLIMKEEYFVRGVFSFKKGLHSMRNVALSSIRYGMDHKAVRFILIITCIQIFSIQALNMYWQVFFKNLKVSEEHLGFLYTGMMFAVALGAFVISKLKCKGREKKMIIQSQVLAGGLVIASTLIPGLPFIIILFMMHEMPRGSWSPLIDSYLQKRIPSEERATISSFCSIAPHIGGAIGLLFSGLIAQYFGVTASWIVAGASLIIGALLVARNGDHESDSG